MLEAPTMGAAAQQQTSQWLSRRSLFSPTQINYAAHEYGQEQRHSRKILHAQLHSV